MAKIPIAPDPPPGFFALNPQEPVTCRRRFLPHWRQKGATYFVTHRLADSLPKEKVDALREDRESWLDLNPPPHSPEQLEEYQRKFSDCVERWLDSGSGSCLLCDPGNAEIVEQAMRYFEGERLRLFAWVVMPNHFHAVVKPLEGHELDDIWHSWERFTARKLAERGAKFQPIWFREGYDRIVRDTFHLEKVLKYIGNNPAKVGLDPNRCRMGICKDWEEAGWSLFREDPQGG